MTPSATLSWLSTFCTPADRGAPHSWRPWSVELSGYRWAFAGSRWCFVLVPDVMGLEEAHEGICAGVQAFVDRRVRRYPGIALARLREWCHCGPRRKDEPHDAAYGVIDGLVINRRLLHAPLVKLQRAFGNAPVALDIAGPDEALVVHGTGWYVGLMPVHGRDEKVIAALPQFPLLAARAA